LKDSAWGLTCVLPDAEHWPLTQNVMNPSHAIVTLPSAFMSVNFTLAACARPEVSTIPAKAKKYEIVLGVNFIIHRSKDLIFVTKTYNLLGAVKCFCWGLVRAAE
jgi:hypothetical protein